MIGGGASSQQVLTPLEVKGLRIFIGKGQCVTCHSGPLFTDQHFHNTGVPPRDPAKPDRGRAAAITNAQKDEFNCLGPFGDAKPAQCQERRFMATHDPALEGAFKTPSLRDVSLRPPYMHAGQFGSIEEVIAHYIKAPAWSRTFRSQALSTNAGGVVRSRRGLLIEAEVASKRGYYVLPTPASSTAIALDATLDDIAARYGEPTANLVALELEYRRRRSGSPRGVRQSA